jgi:hypothetical protein
MTIGGEGSNGFKHSKESKIKMSEAKMGFLVSEETKRTISKTMIEKNNILKYEKTPTTRGNFKQICNNRGLDFDDFIEVKSSLAVSGKIKYYYINKERTND